MMKTPAGKTPLTITSRSKAMRIPRKRISQLVDFIAEAENADFTEIDIAVVGKREMSGINRRYLKHGGSTDVMSFDLGGPGENIVAEIIVCSDIAVQQAESRGNRHKQRELLLYITHGLLHVLGYDDTTAGKAKKMYARQEKLLDDFYGRYRSTLFPRWMYHRFILDKNTVRA